MNTGGTASERRYWAFVSHSHSDARWASWLVRQLETYAVPAKLVGRPTPAGPAPRRFRPIFRDREELAANPSLRAQIEQVLDRSEYLILVCSPEAARSAWVNDEVAYFRARHDDGRIFCVIVGGEPWASSGEAPDQECFPPALRAPRPGAPAHAEPFQPIAADLRPGRDGARPALLKLLSGLLAVGLDDLINRDARRRQRQLAAVAGGSFIGMLAMGGLAAVALNARNEALAQRRAAEGLIQFMLRDLRKTLEPVGRLDTLDAMAQKAMRYYSAQDPGQLDAESLAGRAEVQHLAGDVDDQKGDLAAALRVYQEAARSTGELLKREPDNWDRIYDHAQSVYRVGYIAWRRGQVEQALKQFNEYKALAGRLMRIDPHNDKSLQEVGYANSNLGSVYQENSRSAEAALAFAACLKTQTELVARAPDERSRQVDLGQSYAGYADAEQTLGDLSAALSSRLAERRIYMRLLARNASDSDVAESLLVNREAMAKIMMQQQHFAEAAGELETAARDGQALVGSDPHNTEFPAELSGVYALMGQAELEAGASPAAELDARRALELAETLVRKDPTVVDWQGRRLGGARVLQMEARAQQARGRAAVLAALAGAPEEFRRLALLSQGHPHDLLISRIAGEAAVLAGDARWVAGDRAGAAAIWDEGARILQRAGGIAASSKYDRRRIVLTRLQERRQGRADWQVGKGIGQGLPKYLW